MADVGYDSEGSQPNSPAVNTLPTVRVPQPAAGALPNGKSLFNARDKVLLDVQKLNEEEIRSAPPGFNDNEALRLATQDANTKVFLSQNQDDKNNGQL